MPSGIVLSTMPAPKLLAMASGEGKTHGRHSPSLDAPSHTRRRAARNSTRRRLPRIVDLLTHHLLDLEPQLLHDAADIMGDVALARARARQRDGLVELDAPGAGRHEHD